MVKIAPVHPDFLCETNSLSLMGSAGRRLDRLHALWVPRPSRAMPTTVFFVDDHRVIVKTAVQLDFRQLEPKFPETSPSGIASQPAGGGGISHGVFGFSVRCRFGPNPSAGVPNP